MVPTDRFPGAVTVSRLLSGVAVGITVLAAIAWLFPRPLADAFFAGWVLFGVGLALLGALGTWTRRTPVVWVAALLLTVLSIVGIWSIGFYIAPAALVLLASAVLLQRAGQRPGAVETVRENPPSVLEAVLKTVAGAILAVLGAGLFYEGTFVRELFIRGCASETLACALAVTRWDAVGLTLVGLAAMTAGGWLVWRQIAIGRVLASNPLGDG